jgi:hypothetical protein
LQSEELSTETRGKRDEQLTKIRVDLPSTDRPLESESFWAEPLGGDLYRVRNTPFYAFDLHFGDVVRALRARAGELPTIREVVERSGHKTLRVIFTTDAADADISKVLEELNKQATNHEHAHGRLYSLDVRPEGNYPAVCDYLSQLEQRGVLHYETGTSAGEYN